MTENTDDDVDLGITFDGVDIIANDRRIRSTSSNVTFTDIERLTGNVAKNAGDEPTIQANDATMTVLPVAATHSTMQPRYTESTSILTMEGGIFEMKTTTGDTHLSCDDFDDSVVNFYMQGFKRKSRVEDLAGKHRG